MDFLTNSVGIVACDTDVQPNYDDHFSILSSKYKNTFATIVPAGQDPAVTSTHMNVDAVCVDSGNSGALQDNAFAPMKPVLYDNIMNGMASVIYVAGPADILKYSTMFNKDHGILWHVIRDIALDRKMKMVGADLTATVSFVEIYNERVRDVMAAYSPNGKPVNEAIPLSNATTFKDVKTKANKPYIDIPVAEVPLDSEALEVLSNASLKSPCDSTGVITINYKLKDCGVIKYPTITICCLADPLSPGLGQEGKKLPLNAGVGNFFHCVDLHATNTAKKKTGFVPWKNTVVSNMFADAVGGASTKLLWVWCLGPPVPPNATQLLNDCVPPKLINDFINDAQSVTNPAVSPFFSNNDDTLKYIGRMRAVQAALKQNERISSANEMKQELDTLRKRHEENVRKNAEEIRQWQNKARVIDEKVLTVETRSKDRLQRFNETQSEMRERDDQIAAVEAILVGKRESQGFAKKAFEDIQAEEEVRKAVDREIRDMQSKLLMQEVELTEARQVLDEVTLDKERQLVKESDAEKLQKQMLERTLAHLFRAATTLTLDKSAISDFRKKNFDLNKKKQTMNADLTGVTKNFGNMEDQLNEVKAMFETYAVTEAEATEAEKNAIAALESHIERYRKGERDLRDVIAQRIRERDGIHDRIEVLNTEHGRHVASINKRIQEYNNIVEGKKAKAKEIGILTDELSNAPRSKLLITTTSKGGQTVPVQGGEGTLNRSMSGNFESQGANSTNQSTGMSQSTGSPSGVQSRAPRRRVYLSPEQAAEEAAAAEMKQRNEMVHYETEQMNRATDREKDRRTRLRNELDRMEREVSELESSVAGEVEEGQSTADRHSRVLQRIEELEQDRVLLLRNHADLEDYVKNRLQIRGAVPGMSATGPTPGVVEGEQDARAAVMALSGLNVAGSTTGPRVKTVSPTVVGGSAPTSSRGTPRRVLSTGETHADPNVSGATAEGAPETEVVAENGEAAEAPQEYSTAVQTISAAGQPLLGESTPAQQTVVPLGGAPNSSWRRRAQYSALKQKVNNHQSYIEKLQQQQRSPSRDAFPLTGHLSNQVLGTYSHVPGTLMSKSVKADANLHGVNYNSIPYNTSLQQHVPSSSPSPSLNVDGTTPSRARVGLGSEAVNYGASQGSVVVTPEGNSIRNTMIPAAIQSSALTRTGQVPPSSKDELPAEPPTSQGMRMRTATTRRINAQVEAKFGASPSARRLVQ